MKKLICEMCGSADLIKEDGVFVCQCCGCKYSIEDAKRMMIDGVVDVRGTVEVDNSNFVKNYLTNARLAMKNENWNEVEKYYNAVKQNDPGDVEAIIYSAYGKAMLTLTDSDLYKRQAAFKVLKNCILSLSDHYYKRKSDTKSVIIGMYSPLNKMFRSEFVFTEWKNGYGVVTENNKNETYVLFIGIFDAFAESINKILEFDYQAEFCKVMLNLCSSTIWIILGLGNENPMSKLVKENTNSIIKQITEKYYWSEHRDERAALDKEKEVLTEEIENLRNSPEMKAKERIESEIKALNAKLSITFFNGKKVKNYQEKISALRAELVNIQNSVENIEDQINGKFERIGEIDAAIDNPDFDGTRDKFSDIDTEIENSDFDETYDKFSEIDYEDAKNVQKQSIKVGDVIKLGSYRLDNENGNVVEKIKWKVLDVQDNKALLISKYGLQARAYNDELISVTWENCTLRKWLNDDFYNEAFSSETKNVIFESEVTSEDNPELGTSAGNSTKDKLFLLSISEAQIYFKSDKDRECKATEYAIKNGAYSSDNNVTCWWLRSPGVDCDMAAFVDKDGYVFVDGCDVDDNTHTVRPAMWISMK